jgi:periplasmic protein TonB
MAATGVAGDVPGGSPCGQTGRVIGGILSSAPVAKPTIAPPERVRVSQGVTQGLLVKRVNPECPPEAIRGRIDGTVCLHVIINKAGDVAMLELISGHPALAQAAIDAVKQWKYKPYLLNGQPVEVETQVQVNFTLGGG